MGYNYSYPTYNPFITTQEPPSKDGCYCSSTLMTRIWKDDESCEGGNDVVTYWPSRV